MSDVMPETIARWMLTEVKREPRLYEASAVREIAD